MQAIRNEAGAVIAREEILEQLEVILADSRFASADRNAKFLRFVVESALEGRAGEIKETVIAAEVYGRGDGYDPKIDSIVRVEASRLRQKLRNYYDGEGRSAGIRFYLPTGSYIPRFERRAQPRVVPEVRLEASPLPVESPAIRPAPPSGSSRSIRLAALAAGLAVIAVVAPGQLARGSRTVMPQDDEASAAWKEGVALLNQDPHTSLTERGAPKTLVRAIERLEFAVARNPRFPKAWASLAEAYDYVFAYVGRDRDEDARRAEAAARKAIELDENLAAGHHMLGLVLGFIKWDFQGSEAAYKRALGLDPQNVWAMVEYADLLRETGRAVQAGEEIRSARALMPAQSQLAVKEAEIYLDLDRVDAALHAARSGVELSQTSERAHLVLGMALEAKGDLEGALGRYRHVLRMNPVHRHALPAYGYLLARTGQLAEARSVVARIEKMNAEVRNCAFQVAVVYAGLGESSAALDWLEGAWRSRQAHFPFAAVEYRFRDLHRHGRFHELLGRVGLRAVEYQKPLPSFAPGRLRYPLGA